MTFSGANGNGHQRTAMVRFIMPELELGTMVEVRRALIVIIVVVLVKRGMICEGLVIVFVVIMQIREGDENKKGPFS